MIIGFIASIPILSTVRIILAMTVHLTRAVRQVHGHRGGVCGLGISRLPGSPDRG